MFDDEYVSRVVVDIDRLTFYLYSSEGDSKNVECDDSDEFLNVLRVCTSSLKHGELVYTQ